MVKLNERLSELLSERQMTVEEVAKKLNVSVQTVYAWKSGKQRIFLSNLICLCNLLDCTLDFVAGRSDKDIDFVPQEPPKFCDAICALMKKQSITSYKLRQDTRFDGSYFARWNKGAEPYLSTLVELANYFDVTLDVLVGRDRT